MLIIESRPQLHGAAMSVAYWMCCSITYDVRTWQRF